MKQLLSSLAFLIAFIPAIGCGQPDRVEVYPDHCKDYIKPVGTYSGNMLLTIDGEVEYDGPTSVTSFQSGGHGTRWSGLTGTANDEVVVVDYPPTYWFQYTVSTEGTASLTDAQFLIVYDSEDETVEFEYIFSDLVKDTSANAARVYHMDIGWDAHQRMVDRATLWIQYLGAPVE